MAVPKETLWELDPHTQAKHAILERYLKAWFPIITTREKRIIYIDGFSGPGRYKSGEPGSPLIALNTALGHTHPINEELIFWFIDENEDRSNHLKEELSALSIPAHYNVKVESGKFHEKFKILLDNIETSGANLAPTFAFIDPFGFSGIPFNLIERLFKQEKCEVFITFMVDAINRFLEHPDDAIVQHIVDAFGTNEAIQVAKDSGGRITQLRTLYQERLKQVAKFVRYFEIRDKHDRVQYYLFFATKHALGHVKMKESMWSVDPDGDFRFSDATNPDQLILFESNVTPVLAKELLSYFQDRKKVPIGEVRVYVENETPYLKKHMGPALSQEEGAGTITIEPLKLDGKKRRKNTYPDDAVVNFL